MKRALRIGLLVVAVMVAALTVVAVQQPFHVSIFRYSLFTHCGPPRSIRMHGSWWRLADRSTAISGPNFTDGVMTMTDPNHAVFVGVGTRLTYVHASQPDRGWLCD